MRRPRRTGLAAALAALCALFAPQAAHAGHTQQSFFQDDRLLVQSGPLVQIRAMDQLSSLGVDAVHTIMNWRRIAPDPTSPTVPPGFDGSNPASYPAGNWDAYDNLVRLAAARGIAVIISPAGPVPNWASECKFNVNQACKPKPAAYRSFVTAIARRYSGTYVDEDQDQKVLPRVSRWSVWNEPNLAAWLYPQTGVDRHHRRVPLGAARYRRLVYAASSALRATGHTHDQLLVGETAPIGGGRTRTTPIDFLLQLFCLDRHGHVFRGAMAKIEGCTRAPGIHASGIAHHPYARGAGIPIYPKEKRGSLTIGVIDRFVPLLRQLRHSPLAPKRLPVYFTEFGITTKPPDGRFGVPLNSQAELVNEVDYLAYLRPWIKSVSQFQLEDDIGLAKKNTFQTGLMFGGGAPKPSLVAYRMPIFVINRGKRTFVFGQVRPARGHPQRVDIQFAPKEGGWQTLATRATNSRGYLYTRFKARRGSWRLRWVAPDGSVNYSRVSGAVPPSSPVTPGVPPPGPGPVPPPPPPGPGPGTPPPVAPGPESTPPPTMFTLSVTVSGPTLPLGSGTVTSQPTGINCSTGGSGQCSADYTSGTSVTLTASTSGVAQFQSWDGCDGVSGNTCTVAMSQARTVTARFGP